MKWTGFAAWAKREQRAGDRLPYSRLLNDSTVQLRDGSLMQCWCIYAASALKPPTVTSSTICSKRATQHFARSRIRVTSFTITSCGGM